eukprot:CAMPEP_0194202392 /NCGR_PEP_ID=MMETSP0156-20130528/2425_1 /TAXON_ID=33649 /ORGANISM="Thalassionema nitzschioides, Strain L26-B" /LENGTH=51 /DNA_ID=CAMNT_0038927869 /DNA_START=51 /DNA_END=202 /DNA_ORIENTATION=+
MENLQKIVTFSVSGNQITGTTPSTIGSCPLLRDLWLDDNLFSGAIPTEIGS